MPEILQPRSVRTTIPAQRTTEGGGVVIRRAFPTQRLEDLDPFLLLDHLGPTEYAPGNSTGFPDHPHRGFETVTYLLSGQMRHRDSFGNEGLLNPGDVQWMTAGSGLVHSEMPGPDMVREGGTLQGFQLWVNLPRASKMVSPRYQELKAKEIPEATAPGAKAKVIAGEVLGTAGVIETRTPMLYTHLTLQPGASHSQPVPRSWNVFAYYLSGTREGKADIFSQDGDAVAISNQSAAQAEVLLIGGQPIGEPVARYGPFVMNTREEIMQAADDFRNGRMGSIN
jgi:redox-sensitive bicupin YhaK (pirin superfamily)